MIRFRNKKMAQMRKRKWKDGKEGKGEEEEEGEEEERDFYQFDMHRFITLLWLKHINF